MTAIMLTTVGTNTNDIGEYHSLIRQLWAHSRRPKGFMTCRANACWCVDHESVTDKCDLVSREMDSFSHNVVWAKRIESPIMVEIS